MAGLAPGTAAPRAPGQNDAGATGRGPTPTPMELGPSRPSADTGPWAWARSLDMGVLTKIRGGRGDVLYVARHGSRLRRRIPNDRPPGLATGDVGIPLKMTQELAGTSMSFSGILESLRIGFSLYVGPWAAAVQGWLSDASFVGGPPTRHGGDGRHVPPLARRPERKDVQRWADRVVVE